MSSADKNEYSEQFLTSYLLGTLPVDEAERLDVLSIEDDEFAWRLSATENDLVDAYARGELSGETLERFRTFYLASPKRQEKVAFAQAFLRLDEDAARAPSRFAPEKTPLHSSPEKASPNVHNPWSWFSVPRLAAQWVFAGVALLMLFASAYLFVENGRLRKQESQARDQQTALEQRTEELERQLSEQRSANSGMLKELEHLRESMAGPQTLKIVSALLLPQVRGTSQIPTVSLPVGTAQVQLRLQLESDDFPSYRIALKDPVGSRVIWRTSDVRARAEGDAKVVSINIPADLLKQRNYVIELAGLSSNGRAEPISGYPLRVVRE